MSVLFDIRSIFLMGAICSIVCALTLFGARRLHPASFLAMVWGAAALAVEGAAMLAFAFRGLIPDTVSYLLANALAPAAVLLIFESVRLLCGQRNRPWLIGLGIAALLLIQLQFGSDPAARAARIMVTSACDAALIICLLPILWRRRGLEPVVPLRWAIGFAALFGLMHCLRLAMAVVGGVAASRDGHYAGGMAQSLFVALFAVTPVVYAMIVLSWVNARIAREWRLLAATDDLTGLLVRRSFFERARTRLTDAGPNAQATALLMLDLDRFKAINDRFGHAVGDMALAHFAATLRLAAAPGDLLGRYGGEEFCALVTRDTRQAVCGMAAGWCRTLAATPLQVDGQSISMTMSIGVSHHQAGSTLETLLVEADRFVYQAKAQGRNRVVDASASPRVRQSAPRDEAVLRV